MPEFIPVLTVAVVLLLVLLVAFGGVLNFQPIQTATKTVFLGEHFTVSYIGGEESMATISGTVSKGIISGVGKSISFDASRLDEVINGRLDLKVVDTNLYGRLVVFLNGKEIYRKYPRLGNHSISFTKDMLVSKDNAIDIVAEGSGWRIWAPTAYIFNGNVLLDFAGLKKQTYTFDLTDADLRARNARFVLFLNSQTGRNLIVKLNSYELFRGSANTFLDFPTNLLKTGTNAIEFTTEPNSNYDISSSQVILSFQ